MKSFSKEAHAEEMGPVYVVGPAEAEIDRLKSLALTATDLLTGTLAIREYSDQIDHLAVTRKAGAELAKSVTDAARIMHETRGSGASADDPDEPGRLANPLKPLNGKQVDALADDVRLVTADRFERLHARWRACALRMWDLVQQTHQRLIATLPGEQAAALATPSVRQSLGALHAAIEQNGAGPHVYTESDRRLDETLDLLADSVEPLPRTPAAPPRHDPSCQADALRKKATEKKAEKRSQKAKGSPFDKVAAKQQGNTEHEPRPSRRYVATSTGPLP